MRLRTTWHLRRVGVLAGVGLFTWSLAEYLRVRRGASNEARWLARDLNRLDRWGRARLCWAHPAIADRLGDGLAVAATPAISALLLRRSREPLLRALARDAVPVTEAAVVAGLINQLTKQLAMRERPAADRLSRRAHVHDRFGSFFSGHAAATAVICTSTALRRSRHGRRPLVLWALPVPALLTGYLRVAADKHYLSDVLAGLAVGALVAVLCGWIFEAQY